MLSFTRNNNMTHKNNSRSEKVAVAVAVATAAEGDSDRSISFEFDTSKKKILKSHRLVRVNNISDESKIEIKKDDDDDILNNPSFSSCSVLVDLNGTDLIRSHSSSTFLPSISKRFQNTSNQNDKNNATVRSYSCSCGYGYGCKWCQLAGLEKEKRQNNYQHQQNQISSQTSKRIRNYFLSSHSNGIFENDVCSTILFLWIRHSHGNDSSLLDFHICNQNLRNLNKNSMIKHQYKIADTNDENSKAKIQSICTLGKHNIFHREDIHMEVDEESKDQEEYQYNSLILNNTRLAILLQHESGSRIFITKFTLLESITDNTTNTSSDSSLKISLDEFISLDNIPHRHNQSQITAMHTHECHFTFSSASSKRNNGEIDDYSTIIQNQKMILSMKQFLVCRSECHLLCTGDSNGFVDLCLLFYDKKIKKADINNESKPSESSTTSSLWKINRLNNLIQSAKTTCNDKNNSSQNSCYIVRSIKFLSTGTTTQISISSKNNDRSENQPDQAALAQIEYSGCIVIATEPKLCTDNTSCPILNKCQIQIWRYECSLLFNKTFLSTSLFNNIKHPDIQILTSMSVFKTFTIPSSTITSFPNKNTITCITDATQMKSSISIKMTQDKNAYKTQDNLNGVILFVGTCDGTVYCWGCDGDENYNHCPSKTWKLITIMEHSNKPITQLLAIATPPSSTSSSNDSGFLLTGDSMGTIRLYRPTNDASLSSPLQIVAQFSIHKKEESVSVACSSLCANIQYFTRYSLLLSSPQKFIEKQNYILVVSYSGQIKIWNYKDIPISTKRIFAKDILQESYPQNQKQGNDNKNCWKEDGESTISNIPQLRNNIPIPTQILAQHSPSKSSVLTIDKSEGSNGSLNDGFIRLNDDINSTPTTIQEFDSPPVSDSPSKASILTTKQSPQTTTSTSILSSFSTFQQSNKYHHHSSQSSSSSSSKFHNISRIKEDFSSFSIGSDSLHYKDDYDLDDHPCITSVENRRYRMMMKHNVECQQQDRVVYHSDNIRNICHYDSEYKNMIHNPKATTKPTFPPFSPSHYHHEGKSEKISETNLPPPSLNNKKEQHSHIPFTKSQVATKSVTVSRDTISIYPKNYFTSLDQGLLEAPSLSSAHNDKSANDKSSSTNTTIANNQMKKRNNNHHPHCHKQQNGLKLLSLPTLNIDNNEPTIRVKIPSTIKSIRKKLKKIDDCLCSPAFVMTDTNFVYSEDNEEFGICL